MTLTYDADADAVYLRLGEARIVDSETVAPGVVLDYDANTNIVGVGMLSVSKRVTRPDTQRMLMETLVASKSEVSALSSSPPS